MNKLFIVNFDRTWSEDIRVKAKNRREAKKKAWERFKKRPKKMRDFSINIDEY